MSVTDTERLTFDFEQASSALKRQAGEGMGLLSRRRNAEARYGIAYQQLVKAGLKPPLRGKYRQ